MTKFSISLGLADKDSKKEEFSISDSKAKVIGLLTGLKINGGSLTEMEGFYRHENGVLVVEKSLKIEYLELDENLDKLAKYNKAMLVCDMLKNHFNQESVLLEVSEIDSYFI